MDLAAAIADWPVGSASVAVVGPDGVLDVHDDGQRHRWASVTKIVSALTVLDGCAEGVVSLDDEVGPPGATLRHLLCHAAGLSMDSDATVSGVGKRRVYSNRGIDLAAEHLAAATGRPFVAELDDRVLGLLDMTGTALEGPPSHGARGPIGDLARLARELLAPRLLLPSVVDLTATPVFADLVGIVPGFGRQTPNPWGLGCEVRGEKSPHWTAPENSPETFGHFGQSGSFLWVDRDVNLACVSLCDTRFGQWAATAWPAFNSRVRAEYAH